MGGNAPPLQKGKRGKRGYNYTGQQFGMLTVLYEARAHVQRKNGKVVSRQRKWWCRCSCGRKVIRNQYTLLHLVGMPSCGNHHSEIMKAVWSGVSRPRGNKSCRWRGHGELPKRLWSAVVSGAEERHISLSITIKDAWKQFEKQGGKCALSGLPLQFGDYKTETTASLDRIDNEQGYIKGNIQWLHKWINLMKLDHSVVEFIKMCTLITKNTRRREQKRLSSKTKFQAF